MYTVIMVRKYKIYILLPLTQCSKLKVKLNDTWISINYKV